MKRSQLIADTACKKQETGFWTHLLFYININWFVINTSCWVTNASFCSIARIKTTCAELYESVSYISNSPIIKIGSHGFISPLWLKKIQNQLTLHTIFLFVSKSFVISGKCAPPSSQLFNFPLLWPIKRHSDCEWLWYNIFFPVK